MQWKAKKQREDAAQKDKNKNEFKSFAGPVSQNKFGGPGEVSPAPPLSLGLVVMLATISDAGSLACVLF